MDSASSCWCGNRVLEPFSSDYLHCAVCETLVVAKMPQPEELLVRDDERDYYGKHYFDETAKLHGLPPLSVRARADLPERCLHWLRTLLRYCSPPASILELGSAHGGYVAMMRWAGFNAVGLDLSPEIVAGARHRFDVPVLEGPLESQDIAPGSLDAIVMMDVLEHLGSPKETLEHCLRLLKPSGLIFLQTPQYREGKSMAQMEKEDDAFLHLLTPDQHLFLFSRSSVRRLFRELGVEHVNFEPAIFSFYDMALVAGGVPPAARPESDVVASLEATPSGRLILALYDLDLQCMDLTLRLNESEADRALRLDNNRTLEKLLAEQSLLHSTHSAAQSAAAVELTNRVAERDAQISELTARLEDLTLRLSESEADRALRLDNNRTLEKLLAEQSLLHSTHSAAQSAAAVELTNRVAERDAQISELTARLEELEALGEDLRIQIAHRDEQLEAQLGSARQLALSLESGRKTFSTKAAALEAIYQDLLMEVADHKQVIELQKHRLAKAEAVVWNLRRSRVVRVMRRIRGWNWLDALEPDSPAGQRNEITEVTLNNPANKLRRVAVDLTPVLPGGGNGGAKVMTLDLIQHLSRLAADCEFILLTSEKSHDELAALDAPNVRRVCVSRLADAGLSPDSNSIVRQLGADLLFCPFTAAFYFDPGVPMVCVVYDLQHAYYPEFFTLAESQERGRNLTQAIQAASKIICISDFVRETVLDKTSALPERVETVHILLPRRLGTPSLLQCQGILKKLSLVSGQFLLYPANFWPHKNHDLLLTAFGIYLAGHPGSKLKLVLTGSPGARQEFLVDATRRMGLSQSVLFPGYLAEEELSALFYSCMALIFPSLFEGFGMPLLEAMAAGRPILCSDLTSLPEVAGGAALLFDPRKPCDIADAIARISNEPDLRRDLAAKSTRRLAAFGGPEDMATSYLEKFRQAVQGKAETLPGVYEAFEDGWLGERVTVVFGSGPDGRRIQLTLELPEWVHNSAVSVRVEIAGAAARHHRLVRGEVAVISSPIASSSGCIKLFCSPAFQPCACGLGNETRFLTCRLKLAEIVATDEVRETLNSIRYGA